MPSPLLCYITDRAQFPGDEASRRVLLLGKIAEAAEAGLDYIQLREKDLTTHELESLASRALEVIQESPLGTKNRELRTKLLINSRTDIAIAVSAAGVHLRANDPTPTEVRRIAHGAHTPARLMITQSCHTPEAVQQAAIDGADLAVFAPVFEKQSAPATKPTGLDALRAACQYKIPVLALGGVTLENAADCLCAGAVGIAAIRLFQDHDLKEVVRRLQRL
jgi:thiamine-phosphate pyrophosphorylase